MSGAAATAMREPPRAVAEGGHAGASSLTAAFRQTAATGRWILTQPLVLLVIVAGNIPMFSQTAAVYVLGEVRNPGVQLQRTGTTAAVADVCELGPDEDDLWALICEA